MKCSSYCTASDHEIDKLVNYLNELGLESKYFNEVIYIQKESRNNENPIDAFFFPLGCIVIWGENKSQEKPITDLIYGFEINTLEQSTLDFIYLKYNNSSTKIFIDEEQNEIILGDTSKFVTLSMLYVLAQSIKLNVLEIFVSNLFNKTTPIQQELANTVNVSLLKREISKQIGILFNERYSINLHSDIFDTPEFFWRRPGYEPLYLMTVEFQDIQVRQNILNHRLNMIHELYTLLVNDLNYKHSTKLEWIIIILIAIEVVFAFSHNNVVSKLLNLFN